MSFVSHITILYQIMMITMMIIMGIAIWTVRKFHRGYRGDVLK